MQQLKVDLGHRAYPILIGDNLFSRLAELLAPHLGKRAMIVTNDVVAPLYLDSVIRQLDGVVQCEVVVLPDGEKHKTLASFERIQTSLLEGHHDRHTTLVALGGGVIGDMTGFAAACFQRGVNFVQLPTTLLAQVDSSVGGKTGVNHPLGKNMIGAFHQPQIVVIDTATLASLPDREFAAGIAEVIKYGLLGNLAFFEWIEANSDALNRRDAQALAYAIRQSCSDKAKIVAQDEREAGVRAYLNLGHTFGHAIEAFTEYQEWLHGEAVAVGMVMAAEFSKVLGHLGDADVDRVVKLVRAFGLPYAPPPAMTADHFLRYMSHDKKVADGVIRLVLLRSLGSAYIDGDYGLDVLTHYLSFTPRA